MYSSWQSQGCRRQEKGKVMMCKGSKQSGQMSIWPWSFSLSLVEEFYSTQYHSGSLSLVILGSVFHCFFFLFLIWPMPCVLDKCVPFLSTSNDHGAHTRLKYSTSALLCLRSYSLHCLGTPTYSFLGLSAQENLLLPLPAQRKRWGPRCSHLPRLPSVTLLAEIKGCWLVV